MSSQRTKYIIQKLALFCLLAAMGSFTGKGAVAGQEIDDEHLKAIVKEVIQENPKLILDLLFKDFKALNQDIYA